MAHHIGMSILSIASLLTGSVFDTYDGSRWTDENSYGNFRLNSVLWSARQREAFASTNPRGGRRELTVLSDIPYGHKIALRDIAAGEHIIKYGESIGAAERDIPAGSYVHVHNIVALRGRGDL